MSCPRTQHLLQAYLADDLTPLVRDSFDRHLLACEHCNAELERLLAARERLQGWRDERVPHWDRGLTLFRREHRGVGPSPGFWSKWQWAPTAASFAMLAVLLLNVNVTSGEQGFSIAFGSGATGRFEAELARFEERRREELQSLINRIEDRQDSNNLQLMQAVMQQTRQTTAENVELIYAWFEEQRLQDLQNMREGYQQLVDSDYETIRSLQQLAQFVRYTGELR